MSTKYQPGAHDQLARAASLINGAMTWNTTPEGGEYWGEVSNRLALHAAAANGDEGAKKALLAKVSFPPQMGAGVLLDGSASPQQVIGAARKRLEAAMKLDATKATPAAKVA